MKRSAALLVTLFALAALALALVTWGHLLGDGGRGTWERSFRDGKVRSGAETSVLVAAEATSGGVTRDSTRPEDRFGRTTIEVVLTTVDLEGEPVPDATAWVWSGARRDAQRVTTDGAGSTTLELTLPRWRSRTKRTVDAELAQDGCPKLTAEREVTPLHLAGDPVRLELLVEPGRTVEGVVLGLDGEGVDGAELRLGVAPGRFETLRTDREGGWYVHVRPNVTSLWLHARRAYTGASRLERVDLAALPAGEEVALHLEGPHALGGTIRDSLGFPRRRLGVDVRLRSLPPELAEHEVVDFERHGGLSYQTTSVGREGTFEAEHLQRADYAVTVDGVELEPAGHRRWILPCAGFWLEVRRAAGPIAATSFVGGPGWVPREDCRITLASVGVDGRLGEPFEPELEVDAAGRVAVRLEALGTYALSIVHASGDRVEHVLTLTDLGRHPTLALELESSHSAILHPRLPLGATVFDAAGRPTEAFELLGSTRVVDLDSGWCLHHVLVWQDEIGVPPGRYLVEFDTDYGPSWTATVEVESGEVRDVLLTEQVGAVVELRVETAENLRAKPIRGTLRSIDGGWSRPLDLSWRPEDAESEVWVVRFDARAGSYRLTLELAQAGARTKQLELGEGALEIVEVEW